MELGSEGRMRETSESVDGLDEKWVRDSSFDHKGRVPLRSSTGAWKASFFIIALEFGERLSYFGLAINLITYLTKVLHQDMETAAKNVNYWAGVTATMPLIGGFVADAYLGRYSMIVASCVLYLMGLVLLIMGQYVPALKPCDAAEYNSCHDKSNKPHEVVFFTAIYMISAATGGHKPSLESFGADQFDEDHLEERKKKMSYFHWWNAVLSSAVVLGVTVIVYVQDHVGWGVAECILTSVMAICTLVFILGKPFYRYTSPNGSPLTPMLQVFAAAISKRNLSITNPHQLYDGSAMLLHEKAHNRLLPPTNKLRFLDKAAVMAGQDENGIQSLRDRNPWRLATVTQVEETKLVLNMVPIWSTSLMFGVCIAQSSTFFIKQASTMDRSLTSHFTIPPASMNTLGAITMIATVIISDKILVPVLRKMKRDERGISILKRIGIGMALSTSAMVAAAIVERKRLSTVEREVSGGPRMSAFWLAPQLVIIGIGDGFAVVGLQEYFYDQVPDNMRSLGIAFYLSVIGTSSFLSSLLITVVAHLTKKGGRVGWFAKDLNESHLDYFYWLIAAMSGANLCLYLYAASRYSYKSLGRKVTQGASLKGDGVGSIP